MAATKATVPTGVTNQRTGNPATDLSSLLDLVGTDAPTNAIPASTQALIDAGYLTGYQTGGEGDSSQSGTVFQLGPNAPKTQYGDATLARAANGAFTLKNPSLQYNDPNYGQITTTANTIDPSSQRNIYDLIGPLAMSAILGGAGAGLFGVVGAGEGAALSGANAVSGFLKGGGLSGVGSFLGGMTGLPGGSLLGSIGGGLLNGLIGGSGAVGSGGSAGTNATGTTGGGQTATPSYQAPTTQQVAATISGQPQGQSQGNPMIDDLLNPWKQAQNSDNQNRQLMAMLLSQNG